MSSDCQTYPVTTPALLLDRAKLRRNAQRMAGHVGGLGCVLRPHVKTHKSIDVAREVDEAGHTRGITVSTLQEAEYFFANGICDILYAVGVSPNKFEAVLALRERGCDLSVILDSVDMAERLGAFADERGTKVPVLIELDTDGHRAGADPHGDTLLAIGRALQASKGTDLRGVMTHAGSSYACAGWAALRQVAHQERDLSVLAARRLAENGLPCPVVSIGSTPTALAADDLTGVTEVRAGVYTLFDLVMENVGVCAIEDIALTVLVTITGHQRERGLLITDGGWMALSRDRGTATQAVDYAYGAVADASGHVIEGLRVTSANQEHGVLARDDGRTLDFEDYPIGRQLRILPNHACATAAQHRGFHVIEAARPIEFWGRTSGW